jgi:hypothetical protein
MTITHCERHNEYYNSNQDSDDAAKVEVFSDAMRLAEIEALEAIKEIALKHFPALMNAQDRDYAGKQFHKEFAGYVSDMFGDAQANDELLSMVEVD